VFPRKEHVNEGVILGKDEAGDANGLEEWSFENGHVGFGKVLKGRDGGDSV
jgi:hypothetical protein